MSREGTIRSPSAMSAASHAGTSVQVRLRNPGMQRKPRPTSIAVSGMSQSMYDKRTASSAASTPSSYRGPPRCETTYFTYFLLRMQDTIKNKLYSVKEPSEVQLAYFLFQYKLLTLRKRVQAL